jgi:hypothetical protein
VPKADSSPPTATARRKARINPPSGSKDGTA